jgi:hypothetical protein
MFDRPSGMAFALIGFFVLGGTITSWADDRSQGVFLPGLTAAPTGSVRATAAQVDLVGDSVTLRLSVQETSRDAQLLIRGPRFEWLGEGEPYPDRHFPELRVTIDGANVSPDDGFAAFVGKRDITKDLREAGLDPFVIATTLPFVAAPEGGRARSAFNRLIAEHAVGQKDNQLFALWTAQRLFRFALDDKQQSTILLSYRARPGFALLSWRGLSRAIRLGAYCVTESALHQRFATRQVSSDIVVHFYAIPIGIDNIAPSHVSAHIAGENSVFCGSNGEPIFGGTETSSSPRADKDGVLHILRLDPPSL